MDWFFPSIWFAHSKCFSFLGIFTPVFAIGRNFYLVQQGKTWNDSLAYCRDRYTDLATIRSAGDLIKIQTEAQNQHFSSDAWFGVYGVENWLWFKNGIYYSLALINWGPGQPANISQHFDECGVMDSTGYWTARLCIEKFPFLCVSSKWLSCTSYFAISFWKKYDFYLTVDHTE